MTLVLALCAQDGVVLASDGQATSASGVPTKTSTEKLDTLHNKIAYGCAGPAGLRQRVQVALEQEFQPEDCTAPFEELRDRLHGVVSEVQKNAAERFLRRHQLDQGDALDVLFTGVSGGQPWIYEVARDGLDQRHVFGEAIGIVRHYAAYALVSAAHYELTNQGLSRVRLLAYRAVDDAIRTDATSLGLPIHMIEVTESGAKRLPPEHIAGLKDALLVWQEHEREVFIAQTGELPGLGDIEGGKGIEPPIADQSEFRPVAK